MRRSLLASQASQEASSAHWAVICPETSSHISRQHRASEPHLASSERPMHAVARGRAASHAQVLTGPNSRHMPVYSRATRSFRPLLRPALVFLAALSCGLGLGRAGGSQIGFGTIRLGVHIGEPGARPGAQVWGCAQRRGVRLIRLSLTRMRLFSLPVASRAYVYPEL
jgi:hypothetical protein